MNYKSVEMVKVMKEVLDDLEAHCVANIEAKRITKHFPKVINM